MINVSAVASGRIITIKGCGEGRRGGASGSDPGGTA
jgi:hypothetical protein